MATITKDTVIGDVIAIAPESVELFYGMGMHCLGCALSSGETLGEACMVHGVDPDEFINQLNALIGE